MTNIKFKYAQIEKGALPITWVLEDWSDLLEVGIKFKVETDHKPLSHFSVQS